METIKFDRITYMYSCSFNLAHFLPLLAIIGVVLGCSPTDENDDDLDKMAQGTFPPWAQQTMQARALEQSQGLDGAKVKVHQAYNYVGYSWIEPFDNAKLAAVDVSFADYRSGIDLDDIEIIDAQTNENFGSYPDIYFLDQAGKLLPDNVPVQSFGEPIRVLLIFAVRKNTQSVKLGYWGKEIVSEPIPLENDGLAIPEP